MTDAIALLAISQLVCIGGLAYLYAQLQRLRRDVPEPRRTSSRVRHMELDYTAYGDEEEPDVAPQAAFNPGHIATRMNELGVDIPALARRLHRTEDEVRALLRTQGVPR